MSEAIRYNLGVRTLLRTSPRPSPQRAQRCFVPAASAGDRPDAAVYVLASWNGGVPPFTVAETQQVAAETDAFFRDSSSGRFSMPGSVAAPIRLARNVFDSCDATVLTRTPAGPVRGIPARRDDRAQPRRVPVPRRGKPDGGHPQRAPLAAPGRPRGSATRSTLGTPAGGPVAPLRGRRVREHVQRHGRRARRLQRLREIHARLAQRPCAPGGDATHTIGSIEETTTLPQALVITAASGEYWLESRGLSTTSFDGEAVQPPGVAVLAGPGGSGASLYPRANLLLANPSGGARYAYEPGETFVQPGAFSVAVVSHSQANATLRFAWLDRTPAGPAAAQGPAHRGEAASHCVGSSPSSEAAASRHTRSCATAGPCARSTAEQGFSAGTRPSRPRAAFTGWPWSPPTAPRTAARLLAPRPRQVAYGQDTRARSSSSAAPARPWPGSSCARSARAPARARRRLPRCGRRRRAPRRGRRARRPGS